ncbi:MAG: TetR/AcrR family transcriptional regulator [Actinomycetota bacterium]|nr:TetR/AcrR family transcriptional regulator [Actinomycetota bacterium]
MSASPLPRHDAQADIDDRVRHLRSSLRTREILEAAARMMTASGFEEVSMQALAEEAGVSVGLLYRYFSGKEEILFSIITRILDELLTEVPSAIAAAGDDAVAALGAGIGAYCRVIGRHRQAAMLTYWESKSLSAEGRARLKELEEETSRPLAELIARGVAEGSLVAVDAELAAYDILLLAHGWALKHWYFEPKLDLEAYIARQRALFLRAIVEPGLWPEYRPLLELDPEPGSAIRGKRPERAGTTRGEGWTE